MRNPSHDFGTLNTQFVVPCHLNPLHIYSEESRTESCHESRFGHPDSLTQQAQTNSHETRPFRKEQNYSGSACSGRPLGSFVGGIPLLAADMLTTFVPRRYLSKSI